MTDARRTFGPVVLVGVGSAAGAAVAGTKSWAEPALPPTEFGLLPSQALEADMPLAGALALVLLAAWGVLLVTRRTVRRVATYLVLLAATGLVVTTVAAFWTLDDRLAEDFGDLGAGVPYREVGTSMTGWYWLAVVLAVVAVLAAGAAVRFGRTWPEMGTRYDAPAAGASSGATSVTDLWKALDEGRDPTDPPAGGTTTSP